MRKTDTSEERQRPCATAGAACKDVALTVPPGPRDRPAASGIVVLASLPCSHPMWQLLLPVPQASGPPGETCVSMDSCPRCLWSQMRPGVSPEAHLLAYGRSQCDFTREGPAVCGKAVSPGDQQPHAPRPRAQSPPAKRDGSSTPITSDLQKCASC